MSSAQNIAVPVAPNIIERDSIWPTPALQRGASNWRKNREATAQLIPMLAANLYSDHVRQASVSTLNLFFNKPLRKVGEKKVEPQVWFAALIHVYRSPTIAWSKRITQNFFSKFDDLLGALCKKDKAMFALIKAELYGIEEEEFARVDILRQRIQQLEKKLQNPDFVPEPVVDEEEEEEEEEDVAPPVAAKPTLVREDDERPRATKGRPNIEAVLSAFEAETLGEDEEAPDEALLDADNEESEALSSPPRSRKQKRPAKRSKTVEAKQPQKKSASKKPAPKTASATQASTKKSGKKAAPKKAAKKKASRTSR